MTEERMGKHLRKYRNSPRLQKHKKCGGGNVPFRNINLNEIDPFKTTLFLRTKLKTYLNCCICNSSKDIGPHHIHSLRSMKDKNKDPFPLIRQSLNRLQIPVCHNCHTQLTNGTYDKQKPLYFFDQLQETIAKL